MPELPEVETIKRDLENLITNKKVRDIWVESSFEKRIFPDLRAFLNIKNKKFRELKRKAKLLIFVIDKEEKYLLTHLKMTGQLVYRESDGDLHVGGHPIENVETVPNKFTRVIIEFQDKTKLYFNDVRKFGFFKVVDAKGLERELSHYGIEPLDVEFSFEFFNQFLKKNLRLKTILLDQQHLSGLGNIYVDESCFAAGVRPTRLAKTLKLSEKKELFEQIKKILEKAIFHKGTSFSNYRSGHGAKGNFQHYLMVYGRTGELCKKCEKGIIKSLKLGGRTTRYCPICQK